MTQAKAGDTVRMHYTGKLNDGTEFDSSSGRDPLEFKIGEETIIPTLEQAVIGMTAGATQTVTIAADDAYGPRQDDAVQTVERSMIPENVELTVGGQLQAQAPNGQQLLLTVVEMTDESVTLDANHPLAGMDLTFDIELVEIVA
ncbi:MAG: peptidylprolyl isomerase [Rhodospirillaceae bacterium]|nr:peptidylprolyl isomerase [Rhodospirillaceae bacterium]MBT5458946.1 peptidylprolyl isomerase [Rhodospirillaceae bacterium]